MLAEQEGLVDSFPGDELQRLLIWASVRVVHLAVGSCAELRLGQRHEDCGWTGDMRQFEPLTTAIARLTGRSYDDCWWTLSGLAENLLTYDALWQIVQQVASELTESCRLSREDIEALIDEPLRSLSSPRRDVVIDELKVWVDTPVSRMLALNPDAAWSLASG